MRTIAILLAIAMCLGIAGCEEREQKIVASRPSPDGQHVLWVTNEYGGLRSGVVRVHITKMDQVPEPRTEVLRTPECSDAIVGWVDSVTVEVVYESLSANNFFSGAPGDELHTVLVDRRSRSGIDVQPTDGIALPCDPY
jgi:hypothetical protein